MSDERIRCLHCQKTFATIEDRWQHAKMKHKGKKNPTPETVLARQPKAPTRIVEREPSIGSLMADAERDRAMGLPIDDWLADMLP